MTPLVSSWLLVGVVAPGFAAEVEAAPTPGDAPPVEAPAPVGPDRSVPPVVPLPVPFDLPDPVEHRIGTTRVLHVAVPGVRKVSFRVIFHRGSIFLDESYSASDRALGDLWAVAAEGYEPAELEEVLALHQMSLSAYVGYTRSGVDLDVPKEDLEVGFQLLDAVVGSPTFPAKEVKRLAKENRIFLETQAPFSQQAVAQTAQTYAWYGADTPYGTRVLASDWVLSSSDLLTRHARLITESPVTVLVVGDVAWDRVEAGLTRVLSGVGADGDEHPEPAVVVPTGDRVLVFGVPGATQATLTLRTAAPVAGDAQRQSLEFANFALGGHFLSRLNENLREEHGWTYGIGSRYTWLPERGFWGTRAQVATENVAEAITEIDAEIAELAASGPTAAERDAMVRSEIKTWNSAFEDAAGAAGLYEGLLQQRMTVSQARADLERMPQLATSDAAAATQAWLAPGGARLWVLVGDLEGIRAELAAIGWADKATFDSSEAALLGDY